MINYIFLTGIFNNIFGDLLFGPVIIYLDRYLFIRAYLVYLSFYYIKLQDYI